MLKRLSKHSAGIATRFLTACCFGTLASVIGAAPVSDAQPAEAELQPGVTLRVFRVEQPPEYLPDLVPGQTPNADVLVGRFEQVGPDAFAGVPAPIVTEMTTSLLVERAGEHRFRLTSDDGAFLDVNGVRAIENDGRHGMIAAPSGGIELAEGRHALLVRHFDSGGGRGLLLEWMPPGSDVFEAIPPELLGTEAGVTRVISPGLKRVLEGRRPGDRVPLEDVHPSFRVDSIRPEGFKPMVGSMCFDSAGRLIVGTFFPVQMGGATLPDMSSKEPDTLVAVTGILPSENPSGDPSLVRTRVVAEGLFEPAGLVAVGDDLYVAQRNAITRLSDSDGDGFYESHEDVASGWVTWNYHEFTFGLEHIDRDGDGPHPGYLYGTLSTSIAPLEWEGVTSYAGPNGPWRGGVIEIDLSTKLAHVIAGGTRTPNGLGLGPMVDGVPTLFYADNQGSWMPTSHFSEVVPGRFYGHINPTGFIPKLAELFQAGGSASVFAERERMPASVLLPHNELSRSPTQSLMIEDGPFAGQMLLGELTGGGLRRVQLERVNGSWQGAVFRHSQGLEVGVNRLVRGPEGALYIGGIGGNGNWAWNDTRFGLQRLTPTGAAPAFEMHSVSATTDGFVIRFTHDVSRDWLADAANYRVSQWGYEPTEEYGGPKTDFEVLSVASATVVDDRTVRIVVPGLKAMRCVAILADPVSAETGGAIRSPEAWYTLNTRPVDVARTAAPAFADAAQRTGVGVGVLPPADATPLITRNAEPQWRRVGQRGPGRDVREADDLAEGRPYVVTTGGDRETMAVFGDARFHIEWYSPPGGAGQSAGNSGVYVQGLYEVQVLGTLAEGQLGRPVGIDEAGAIYGVRAPSVNASNGPGAWQAYDIWFEAPRHKGDDQISPARMTVYWNGRLVHDRVEIAAATRGREGQEADRPRVPVSGASGEGGVTVQLGPLQLQDHWSEADGPVRYRNVWVQPLERSAFTPGEWIGAFDGESLDGWSVVGGDGTYRVEQTVGGPVIVGTSAPDTPNTFLVLDEPMESFELFVEVMQHPELNSGIQVRSSVDGGIGNRRGRLRGPQVELDPSPRAFTGGVYDEGRRGWLYPLTSSPAARRVQEGAERWNRIRILAEGPRIRTWVNGIPAADVFDAMDAAGHIALQVHGVGPRAEPMEVRWRDLRVRPLIER